MVSHDKTIDSVGRSRWHGLTTSGASHPTFRIPQSRRSEPHAKLMKRKTMFRKLFGRSLETNIEATKVELMTDLLAGLRKAYNKYAAIAWLNIEDDGDEKLRQTATLAMHAFDVGFYGTAAALLEARSLAADFKRHPEYVDFGLEVARQAFSREYDAENLVPTVMDIVGNPKHEFIRMSSGPMRSGRTKASTLRRPSWTTSSTP